MIEVKDTPLYHPVIAKDGRMFTKEEAKSLLELQKTNPTGWTNKKPKNAAKSDGNTGNTGKTEE